MTTQAAGTTVRASVMVEAPIERAFSVFTAEMGTWWPKTHHILEGELAEMVFEPRVGGNIYDRATDGSESRWARVLAYDPPNRLVFSWDISNDFQLESDPSRSSEVEVTFTADGPRRTRVVLEHSKLDAHGDGWERHRDMVGNADGWQLGLDAFAKAAATA
ncbi:MAG TPA: SRPBCC family protein [Candidatus Deferrimicrobium sp.]|nr:SRPBCC family protein [Candidatus Deferrimicrobium sp.]